MKYPYVEAKFQQGGLDSGVKVTMYHDALNCEEWNYDYNPRKHTLEVKIYKRRVRETPRHKWVVKERFGMYDKRQDTLSEMPAPNEVIAELAVKEFCDKLKVV